MVFQVTVYTEDDGSITLSTDNMDLAVNAPSQEAAIKALCRDMVEYAEEYRKEFAVYSAAPNRAAHAPLVKEILTATPQELRNALVFRSEQNAPKTSAQDRHGAFGGILPYARKSNKPNKRR